MNSVLLTLYNAEFKRRFGPVAIVGAIVIAGVGVFFFLMNIKFSRTTVDLVQVIESMLFGLILPLEIVFFGTDLVSSDIYDGWLRSVLLHPVKRHQYLTARLLSSFVFTILALTVLLAAATIGLGFMPRSHRLFDVKGFVVVVLCSFGQGFVYLTILATFSCWLRGFLNVASLAAWGLAGAFLSGYLSRSYWDSAFLVVAKDFIFPSGFIDAASSFTPDYFPVAELLWGIANVAGWLSAAYWSINQIQIDRSFE